MTENKIWMAVYPNKARTNLNAKSQEEALAILLNLVGLTGLARGVRLEYGPESLMSLNLCDFCVEGPASWEYPCDDFESLPHDGALGTDIVEGASGNWMACTGCKEAYEGGGLHALIERATDALWKQHPEVERTVMKQAVRPAYEQFEFMRTGDVRPAN